MSRYDDPRWYEEADTNPPAPRQQAYDDLSDNRATPWRNNTPSPNYTHFMPPGQFHPERPRPRWRNYLLITLLALAAFTGGWFGHQQFGNGFAQQSDSAKYVQLFQEAWNTVDQNYVDRNQVKYDQMSYAAIKAMVDALNDKGHTRFLTPQQIQAENQSLSGKFIGIGVSLNQDAKTKQWSITSAMPGAPAEKAGIKSRDIILSVDGIEITGKSYEDVSKLIQGKEGTVVTLNIKRANEAAPRTFKITRAQIEVQNVTMHYIKESKIAHILIAQFAQGISDQLKKLLGDAKKLGAQKIILDLRNNTGGYLNEAINTASMFMQSGNVLLEQNSKGKRTPVAVNGNTVDTTSPMVVLINGYSASASEIVSGSLKDNKRATLIGEKTFGTGTVLQQFTLSDGSAILIGVQEWLTPNGNFIRDRGIQPDIQVPLGDKGVLLTPNDENGQQLSEQALLKSSDTQLIKAITYLNSR